MKFYVGRINVKNMKLILLVVGFTCFGAGQDDYKVPEGKPRLFFDGTKWRTVSIGRQTTYQRAQRRPPDSSKLFETSEIQELKNNTTSYDPGVHYLISKIIDGIKSGLHNSNTKEVFTIQTTPRPYPLQLFDWLLTSTTTSKKSYLDFFDAITDKNQETNDIQTIDAADLWYGTEPTKKRKSFYRNQETKSSDSNVLVQPSIETTLQPTIRNQMSINFNATIPHHKKGYNKTIQRLLDLLTSYKGTLNRTATAKQEKMHSSNETTPRLENSQIQSQIDDLKDNRNKLIALILDLLYRLKVIMARNSNSGTVGLRKNSKNVEKITIKQKDPMNARKVAQQADSLFSELSYNIDIGSGDVLSDTEIIKEMEDIDVINEKYMSGMFGLNSDELKEPISQKELYDYSQLEDPVDKRDGVEHGKRYKIYNRTETGNILI